MISVLEVGGSHVTAALVDTGTLTIRKHQRTPIDSDADADSLMDTFTVAVQKLGTYTPHLIVAIPGPFNYVEGIGDFEGVAKFGALKGVPLGALLSSRLGQTVSFINDVTAYALGQYHTLLRPHHLVVVTLGTGLGSAFLEDGVPIDSGPSVPENGWVYTLEHEGQPIEETFSRRAIRRAFRELTGEALEVAEIARRAACGDPRAEDVLHDSYTALADTLVPCLSRFRADTVAIGGSIAQSWQFIERWFIPRLEEGYSYRHEAPPRIVRGRGGEGAALIGAAISTCIESDMPLRH